MTGQRDQAMRQWVNQQFQGEMVDIAPLAGDASFRRYARIGVQGRSYMLMDAPPPKEDCRPFVNIAQALLAEGVRVPAILAQDVEQGFLLLEDFGDTVLSAVLTTDTVDQYYTQAMRQLIELQSIKVPESLGLEDYHAEKLLAEMQLFDQWFLPRFLGQALTTAEQQLLNDTYEYLIAQALAQPQVLVHRDYHSRNLMVIHGESNLGVIDFQDAVVGALTYDLVSLLRDAYVVWPMAQVKGWVKTYWQQAQQAGLLADQVSFDQFQCWFDAMAAQRHLKVLGIFVRLSERDGKHGYLNDLPLVLSYLVKECAELPQLAAFTTWLEQRVVPAFLQKVPQAASRFTTQDDV